MSKEKQENRDLPGKQKTEAEADFENQQNKRKSKLEALQKRLKWYHRLVFLVMLAVASVFIIWFFLPKKSINVAVLDKTVLSYSEDDNIVKDNVYRKHRGFFWILDQQRYVKPDGASYDYKRDYFGPMLDDEGAYDYSVEFADAVSSPDLVYLADAYGLGNDTFGHYNGGTPLNGGISNDDMSFINFAYESGAPIIAESALFDSPMSDSVRSQIITLLGVTPTKWIGRYIVDLEDFSDVPDWAPPMYEQQEGVEWRFFGPGILLVSGEGRIIILEQNTDFISKNLLQISINKEYKDEFGDCGKCNFYNWFELIEPGYGVENIATFEFDLNATGMEKIREISKTPRFCAISRRQEEGYAPVYFFAGDFNDYVTGDRYGGFLFANQFYKFLSYDRQGDVSNFFWRFYNPLIRHILNDARSTEYARSVESGTEVSRVGDDSFQVFENGSWRNLGVKAVSLNADEPGEEIYSRDFSYYEKLLTRADDLGVNCIEAKGLYPPEFYAAVSRHNKNPKNQKIYIIQRIQKPDGLAPEEYLTNEGLRQWRETVWTAVDALHGKAVAESEKTGKVSYFIDVSDSLLCLVIDPDLSAGTVRRIRGLSAYSYEGKTVRQCRGISGFAAFLYDTAQSASRDSYGVNTPVSVSSDMMMLKGMSFVEEKTAYQLGDYAADALKQYVFTAVLLDSGRILASGKAADTTYAKFDAVLGEISKALPDVLVSAVTISDVNGIFGQSAVTEKQQGAELADALWAAEDNRLLGAVVYDLNDSWSEVGAEMAPFSGSSSTGHLWHNTCDGAQMTGLIALDSVQPDVPGLVLSDDDVVQAVSLYSDESYVYITLQLFAEIDYKTHAMFVGLDTYQRNDGEYYYSKDFTPNSLSGMEFVLRFEGKQDAALYVTPEYDRTDGSAVTKESYTGEYRKVIDLTYGGFTSGDAQFYQTGSTVNIRLPWTWLNVADPSKKLVISDPAIDGTQAKTVATNGVLLSVMVGERKGGDLIYAFPADKHDPGYKVFEWSKWETVGYSIRLKESFGVLKQFYASI
ncbi:MAG: hypothetical protein II776_05425 [Clostridia bacterium]|nr:hypothetical protein [Clostridia bacterium]